jgi:molybdopterin-guanine dinucleotide biosynthesis protein A
MARYLGAIIAGGQSRRFGSDKALAMIEGKPMLDHVVAALRPQVDHIVICGRDWPGLERIEDQPGPGLGPIGGLNAALHHGAVQGFDAVITVPVDVLPLPGDLLTRLAGDGPAVFAEQHLIGYWPAALAPKLDRWVADGHLSIWSWIEAAQARRVADPEGLANINFRADLQS